MITILSHSRYSGDKGVDYSNGIREASAQERCGSRDQA